MTPAGIEPATFRFVAQHLNHCATAVPSSLKNEVKYDKKRIFYTAIHVDVRCFYRPIVVFWHLNLEPRCCYRLWDVCVYWEKCWYHVPFHETRSFVLMFARAHQCALLWTVGFHEDKFIPFREKNCRPPRCDISVMQCSHGVSWKYTRFIGLLITGEDRYGLHNAVVSKGDNNDKRALVDNRLIDQKLLKETQKNLMWFWRSEYCPYGNYVCGIPVTLFFFTKTFSGIMDAWNWKV